MDKTVRVFRSHADQDDESARYILSLTPQQRVEMVVELMRLHKDFGRGFERVCTVTRRPPKAPLVVKEPAAKG